MAKVWTEEERRLHGEKIMATKRANAARRRQELSAIVSPYYTKPAETVPPPIERKPLLWRDLPHYARKSARNPRVPENTPVVKARCINCRLEMWTRDPKLEDMCETCEFRMIDEKHRLRQQMEKSRGGKLINPFSSESQVNPIVNPFVTGGKLL